MSSIRRFSLRNELYEKILERPEGLERMEIFLRPLFGNAPEKIYNLKKSTELQRPVRKKEQEDAGDVMEFGESWQSMRKVSVFCCIRPWKQKRERFLWKR